MGMTQIFGEFDVFVNEVASLTLLLVTEAGELMNFSCIWNPHNVAIVYDIEIFCLVCFFFGMRTMFLVRWIISIMDSITFRSTRATKRDLMGSLSRAFFFN